MKEQNNETDVVKGIENVLEILKISSKSFKDLTEISKIFKNAIMNLEERVKWLERNSGSSKAEMEDKTS